MPWLRARQPVLAALAVALLGLLVGSCRRAGPPLYPVQGRVLFAGKPAAGALVVFHPVGTDDPAAPKPSATVQDDGSFTLSTFASGDGAPAGAYEVAITWTEDKAKANPDTGEVPSRLPVRYGNPKTSRLRAKVEEGPTRLEPFQLTK
jgi:hypothetical protein